MANLFGLLGLGNTPPVAQGSRETHATWAQPISRHGSLPGQSLYWSYSIFTPPNTPQAPTLYWSHGLGSSVAAERNFAKALSTKGIRVVALDYPGCGHSDWLRTTQGPLTARDITSLEDREKIFSLFLKGALEIIKHDRKNFPETPFAIGGNSLGGVASVRLARHFANDPLLLGLFNCVAFHSLGETHVRSPLLTLFLETLVSTSSLHAESVSTVAVLAKLALAYSGLTLANLSHGHRNVAQLVQSTFEHLLQRAGESMDGWKSRVSQQEHALSAHARMSDFASTPEALRQLQADQKALGDMPQFNVFADGDPLLGDPKRLARDLAQYPRGRAVVLEKSGRIPGPGHLVLPSHPEAMADLFRDMISGTNPPEVSGFRNEGIRATHYQRNTTQEL